MEQQKRRASDTTDLNIEDLIAKENDPDKRLYLLVLNNINNSLMENTHSVKLLNGKLDNHLVQFAEHARNEEALMNKGRGIWIVLAFVLGIAQVLAGYTWVQIRADLESIHAAIIAGQITDAKVTMQIEAIEHRIGDHLSQSKPDAQGLHK